MISIIKFLIMINLCKIYCTCRFHTHRTTRVPGLLGSRKALGRCSGRMETGFHHHWCQMSFMVCSEAMHQKIKFFRYRGNWKGDLPEGKGEYQVKILCLIWNWWLFNYQKSILFPSGRMETSLWVSSRPAFLLVRGFMRQNLETSSSEGRNQCNDQ